MAQEEEPVFAGCVTYCESECQRLLWSYILAVFADIIDNIRDCKQVHKNLVVSLNILDPIIEK